MAYTAKDVEKLQQQLGLTSTAKKTNTTTAKTNTTTKTTTNTNTGSNNALTKKSSSTAASGNYTAADVEKIQQQLGLTGTNRTTGSANSTANQPKSSGSSTQKWTTGTTGTAEDTADLSAYSAALDSYRENKNSGEPIIKIYYFRSGLAQCYVEHEDGHRKNLSFHGPNTVFPGVQRADYKIEQSIAIKALTDIVATAFHRDDFYRLCLDTPLLMAALCEMQSSYINMLIYDAAHQRYNPIFLKVCNFLFLMSQNVGLTGAVDISQENIADTLGVGRNHVTKCLSRLRQENIIQICRRHIEIVDMDKLAEYCSLETRNSPSL